MPLLLAATAALFAALLAAGQGGLARTLFAPLVTLLAILVYRRRRDLYVDLVLWTFFLSPFLRRVMDLQAGWQDPSLVLLTPYLVALVGPALEWRRLLSAPLRRTGFFVIVLMVALYGILITFRRPSGPTNAGQVVQWLVPIVFACWFSAVAEESRTWAKQSIHRSFLWGTMLMGLYGIYQFISPPTWDANWLVQLGGVADVGSMGIPEPFGLRVFSTMNSAGAYAQVMVCGLLVLATSKAKLAPLAFCTGLIALLLTMVRSGWLALAFGLVLLQFVSARSVLRNVAVPIAVTALLIPALAIGSVQSMLTERFLSFTRPGEDASSASRVQGASAAVNLLMARPQGYGVGLEPDMIASDGSFALHDNGFLEALLSLGLLGAPMYFGSMILLAFGSFRVVGSSRLRLTSSGTIVLALMSQLPLGSVYLGITGLLLWTFAAWGPALPAGDLATDGETISHLSRFGNPGTMAEGLECS